MAEVSSAKVLEVGGWFRMPWKDKHHKRIRHPLHWVFKGMVARCYKPWHQSYHRYGGRGIRICDGWLKDRRTFYAWAMANGWKRGLTIDRFPNNDGDYEPSNCRFATTREYTRGRSSMKLNLPLAALAWDLTTMGFIAKFVAALCGIRSYDVYQIKRGCNWPDAPAYLRGEINEEGRPYA
jgi:hypothetical protein